VKEKIQPRKTRSSLFGSSVVGNEMGAASWGDILLAREGRKARWAEERQNFVGRPVFCEALSSGKTVTMSPWGHGGKEEGKPF